MTWDEVRTEIAEAAKRLGRPQHDKVRRAKIAAAEKTSGIPLVIFATDFTDPVRSGKGGTGIQIGPSDKTGFLQALSDIDNGPLDVLLHSPGGSPAATESIVHLLRSRFDPIRFIIPHTSKSAATMLALSGDEILLGEAAELGPIDPQLNFVTEQRPVSVPAGAAIDQFKLAESEITKDPQKFRTWLPIIRQYGPSFLQECLNAIALSEELASTWLRDYMFRNEPNANERAAKVAKWLADHNNFRTHSRPVWMEQLLEVEPALKIKRIGDVDEEFESRIMAVFWSIDVTFGETDAYKLIEHQAGSAYIQLARKAILSGPIEQTRNDGRRVQEAPPAKGGAPIVQPRNRSERRRNRRNRKKKS